MLTLFINKPDSSRDLTIFKISSISSFEIINVVCCAKSKEREANKTWTRHWSENFLFFAFDATAVNPYCMKTLLLNGLRTSLIKGKPIFSSVPRILSQTKIV